MYGLHHEIKYFFAYAKTEAQISSVATAQLISTSFFATPLLPKSYKAHRSSVGA